MTKGDRAVSHDPKRVRYTVELTDRLDHILGRIAGDKGSSKAEVLRFAIDFLDAGMRAKNEGMHVGGYLSDEKDGKLIREREFIGM